MTLWYDSSAPGNSPITSSADIYTWGGIETKFYLAAASNLISGQSTGPSVQFSLQSHRDGYNSFQVDYGTTSPPRECSGHLISVTVPGGNPVSVRVIIADNPQEIAALLVGTATTGGSTAPVPISGALSWNTVSSTQGFNTNPPRGKRWRIWGLAAILAVGVTADTLTVTKWAFTVLNSSALIGVSDSKVVTQALTSGQSYGVALLPTNSINVFGAFTAVDFLAIIPFEIVVETGMTVGLSFTASTGAGPITGTIQVVPLGIEEPL